MKPRSSFPINKLSSIFSSPSFSCLTPTCPPPMAAAAFTRTYHRLPDQKVVVILGATGSGKSRLSIDLATRFFPSEVINSDKMQVFRGLDITTNKMSMQERLGVPHHLLGEFRPSDSHAELTPSEFRSLADSSIASIASRRRLPLVVGGSNSFIYALIAKSYDPELDVFDEPNSEAVCRELRYRCCFLWVDVRVPVLNQYLCKRVDEMMESGMLEELDEYYKSEEFRSESQRGLKKAIGVPEFEAYLKRYGSGTEEVAGNRGNDEEVGARGREPYEEAVRRIKDNTCQLARRQLEKIQRLEEAGWDLRKVDSTETLRASMSPDHGGERSEIWERQVLLPSVKIVKSFLAE